MPELQFRGKEFVRNHHLTVPYRPLVPDVAKSVGPVDLSGNLVVHGDNLEALKALLPTHAGKIDCIFIDPPYNTGNEGWAYNDAVNSPMQREWLSKAVDRDDLLRHDKWLCMMWPRLKLLHELLSERGSLWMTLDDNEVHHARCVLDEVFGEENLAATVIWQKKYTAAADETGIAYVHDYLIGYAKSDWQRNRLARDERVNAAYRFKDEEGIFRVSDYTCNKTKQERPNLFYKITNPNTKEEIFPRETRVWGYSEQQHKMNSDLNLVWWGEDGTASFPYFKRYLKNLKHGGKVVPTSLWSWQFAGHTDAAKKELLNVTPEATFFTPKPVALIERIIEVAAAPDDVILDSFAGSGTTGHAVLAANAKDGGNRRFILVETESYADTLTAGRLRRVINGYDF